MKTKKTFKIYMDNEMIGNLMFVKMKDYDTINTRNSDKFARILADKIVFVTKDSLRVNSQVNPHIASELIEQHCDNYRIDDFYNCISRSLPFNADKEAEYIVNFEQGTAKRKLNANERECKHCHRIVSKNRIIGAFCETCLTREDGFAFRYNYHSFGGKYTIYEKNLNQNKIPVFGAEIERDYLGGWSSDFEYDLKNAMLKAVKILYGEKLNSPQAKRKTVFMRDGSLECDGIEWITFPQSYKAYKKEASKIDEVLKMMRKYNFGNSENVGNHIHINRKFFGDTESNRDESRFAGAKMALLVNEYWEEFLAIARREESDYAEKPIQSKEDKLFTLVRKTMDDEYNHTVAVNLQHNDTIEIRVWAGINNVSDLLLFLDLTQALAIFAKKKSLESCQKAKFKDILAYLTDKKEHLLEIRKRLNEYDIKKHNETIDEMLNKEEK